jgi:porphobilinogen deaminase
MASPLKIGTRESELAVWQATQVKTLLQKQGIGLFQIPIPNKYNL